MATGSNLPIPLNHPSYKDLTKEQLEYLKWVLDVMKMPWRIPDDYNLDNYLLHQMIRRVDTILEQGIYLVEDMKFLNYEIKNLTLAIRREDKERTRRYEKILEATSVPRMIAGVDAYDVIQGTQLTLVDGDTYTYIGSGSCDWSLTQ